MNKTNTVEEENNVDDENDETDFNFDTHLDDYIPNDALDENSDSELNDNERSDDMNGDVENHVGRPFSELKINLGTNELPRFSCACHKSNIAVRHAIASNQHFTAIASKLSRHSSTVKRTLHFIRTHLGQRAKLQINNVTRWSSVYMMLLSYQKAYKKNCFAVNSCPVSQDEIETYLQILFPAFQFSLIMQKNYSSIADVIPALKIMFSRWNRMQVFGYAKAFCTSLINWHKKKFAYELNSDVYKTASLLNTSNLPST